MRDSARAALCRRSARTSPHPDFGDQVLPRGLDGVFPEQGPRRRTCCGRDLRLGKPATEPSVRIRGQWWHGTPARRGRHTRHSARQPGPDRLYRKFGQHRRCSRAQGDHLRHDCLYHREGSPTSSRTHLQSPPLAGNCPATFVLSHAGRDPHTHRIRHGYHGSSGLAFAAPIYNDRRATQRRQW